MKFQKFVKSLGSDGVIYVRKNEERWLGFENVFMKIPDNIRSITASDILPMPESVEKVIKPRRKLLRLRKRRKENRGVVTLL